ncbi:MAG: glycosyltransferase family 4 protein, partial [Gammaproteobacteria bacterium]
ILPSQWYENCPMSILESMAVGTPVLGARIGGITELIREKMDGYVFDAASPASLAEKMKILWANPDLRSKMGVEAARRIRQKHTSDRHYEQLMQLYDSTLQNKHLS